jgi:wyosine [tRNA(Phe)-imidazoG37] synthetase (radical SAM superfamily)
MKYVYGPVPSRRLGRSLGIDLVPYKTCTYDCIYCQLGRTTDKTIIRRTYAPVKVILDELARRLTSAGNPDFISLAGSGEPTLHAEIGKLIRGIKKMTRIPVAVITNGSLLWMPEVREALAPSDVVLPSLDAGDQGLFAAVNRPHEDISFELMTRGLVYFSKVYRGEIWMEVLVTGGLSDTAEEINKIAAVMSRMKPTCVQLNSVARPPAEAGAIEVPSSKLLQLAQLFGGRCEVIAEGRSFEESSVKISPDELESVHVLLARRPCTVKDIAAGLGLPPNQVLKQLDRLCENGAVRIERRNEQVFYLLR